MRKGTVLTAATVILGLAASAAAQEGGAGGGGGPGPWKEPAKTAEIVALLKDEDAAVRAAGLGEAKENQDPALVAALARLLVDEDRAVRLEAAAVLGARTDGKARKSAASSLADRLGRLGEKGEAEERLALVNGLHDLAQPSTLKGLMDGIKTDTNREEVDARLRAVANVPAAEAVEALIDFAAGHGRGQRTDWNAGTRTALRYATRDDVGSADPDLWRAWWRKNGKTFDFEAAAADRKKERDGKAEKERKKTELEEKRKKGDEKGGRGGKGGKKGKDGEGGKGGEDGKDGGDGGG